jgi:hypothetical protein
MMGPKKNASIYIVLNLVFSIKGYKREKGIPEKNEEDFATI